MHIFKSAAELPASTHNAVHALLLALADSKLFLGFHYGEWTFGTPALEASIAACSMAQDEFGHLRLLHGCLNTQFNDHPQNLLEHRAFADFANVTALDKPLRHWADLVAINFLADGALTVLLAALQSSSFEPVANFIGKMLEEEKHHLRNAQGWFNSLAAGDRQIRDRLTDACRRVLVSSLEWLGPAEHSMMRTLKNDGIINLSWQDLTQQFLNWIGPLAALQQMDLGLEKRGEAWQTNTPIDFSQWNAKTRRCAATQPEEQLLYHLRGSKNAIFKLGEA